MNPLTVLIADDHAVMRQGLRALLAGAHDIEIVGEAATGREAVDLVATLQPQAVVMDIAMPDLNGIEATLKITERWPATRVIILSMYADAEYLFRAFQAGACGYLLKESAVDEIIAALHAVCNGRRYVGSGVSLEGAPDDILEARASPLERLSAREREVLQLVVEGHSSAEIGAAIHLSPKTVDSYRSRLMKKLGVKDFAALVKFAVQHGLTRSH
jgi:DNA-binding NarL/FixJ family response regulator